MKSMKQIEFSTRAFLITLPLLLSLLLTTFFALAHPGFELWGLLVALLVNLPMAFLFSWLSFHLAFWFHRRGLNTWQRCLVELMVLLWIFFIVRQFYIEVIEHFHHFDASLSRTLLPACSLIAVIVLCVELHIRRQQLDIEMQEKTNYQLMLLKRQLSPHFLFNSLNVLASLTYQDAETANRFTKRLARIYRYILDTEDKTLVPLSEEQRFVEDYVYLQQIRYNEMVCVEIKPYEGVEMHHVVPGSVQQMVENAIKHNIATRECPLHIVIEYGQEGITVTNNLQLRPDSISHGTGLQNLRMQLRCFGRELQVDSNSETFNVFLPYV